MFYRSVLRPILFAHSSGDAEQAHELAIHAAKKIQQKEKLLRFIAWWCRANKNPAPVMVAGIPFLNPVGLAAGFDKQGEMLPLIQALGFGFAEIGTVLPRPQAGNERPRIFRIPREQAVINRMGFNSTGMRNISVNLRWHHKRISIPVGISVGKMKDTPNADAVSDYIEAWECLRPFGAFCVGNISSPNTPGLRELQGEKHLLGFVERLVGSERHFAMKAGEEPKPVAIKIAPDLNDREVDETVYACESGGASMLIIGNTTLKRPLRYQTLVAGQVGGMSGRQIYWPSRTVFLRARKRTKLPICYVGGLDCYENIRRVRDDGADLIELYTGLIYKGPSLVRTARSAMARH